jgi:hypothetical protein
MNLSQAGAEAGISSKRRLGELVQELRRAGLIKTRSIRGRGNPTVIVPLGPAPTADE